MEPISEHPDGEKRTTLLTKDRLASIDALLPFCVISPASSYKGLYVAPASILISIQGEVHDYLVFFRPYRGKIVITCPSPQFLDIFLDHFRRFPFAELFCRQTSNFPFDLVVNPISFIEAANLGQVDLRWSVYLAKSRGGFPNPFLIDLCRRGQSWAEIFRSDFDEEFVSGLTQFFLTPHILEPSAWSLRFETFWKALLECFIAYESEIHGINLIRIDPTYCNPEPYVRGPITFQDSPMLRFNAEKHLAQTQRLLTIGLDCLVQYYTERTACQPFWKVMEWLKHTGYLHNYPACQKVEFQHSLSRFDEFTPSWE